MEGVCQRAILRGAGPDCGSAAAGLAGPSHPPAGKLHGPLRRVPGAELSRLCSERRGRAPNTKAELWPSFSGPGWGAGVVCFLDPATYAAAAPSLPWKPGSCAQVGDFSAGPPEAASPGSTPHWSGRRAWCSPQQPGPGPQSVPGGAPWQGRQPSEGERPAAAGNLWRCRPRSGLRPGPSKGFEPCPRLQGGTEGSAGSWGSNGGSEFSVPRVPKAADCTTSALAPPGKILSQVLSLRGSLGLTPCRAPGALDHPAKAQSAFTGPALGAAAAWNPMTACRHGEL
ncbi:PREDICTED: cuticle collagen 7-like [Rhinopithecus bieti]|uniref:cuticle collagen 7-like n=1 Tax=Rhinopithecus bieti TaxID=61621 RepID=UPI00083BEE89|nr:PREDICTED: cuticle collagen 7-like [Rhinopithecus bieti]